MPSHTPQSTNHKMLPMVFTGPPRPVASDASRAEGTHRTGTTCPIGVPRLPDGRRPVRWSGHDPGRYRTPGGDVDGPDAGALADGVVARFAHRAVVPRGRAADGDLHRCTAEVCDDADADALALARRLGKCAAVLFAVGAVSGTVLSFEMGIMWPGMMGTFGDVIGLPFALEGIFFFLEAIFLGIYLYGWRGLPAQAAPGDADPHHDRRGWPGRSASWRSTPG